MTCLKHRYNFKYKRRKIVWTYINIAESRYICIPIVVFEHIHICTFKDFNALAWRKKKMTIQVTKYDGKHSSLIAFLLLHFIPHSESKEILHYEWKCKILQLCNNRTHLQYIIRIDIKKLRAISYLTFMVYFTSIIRFEHYNSWWYLYIWVAG